MTKESQMWLIENGFDDKVVGNATKFIYNLTGEVIDDPPLIYTSEVMDYWKKITINKIIRKMREDGATIKSSLKYITHLKEKK